MISRRKFMKDFVKGVFLVVISKQDSVLEELNNMEGAYDLDINDVYVLDLESKCLVKEKTLENKYEINIEFDNISFPEYWNNLTINYKISNSLDQKIQVLDSLERELSKYPTKFIKKSIDTIQIPKELVINEIEYGGTYSLKPKTMYLTESTGRESGGFHHELAHMTKESRMKEFDIKLWKSLNQEGFEYEGNVLRIIKEEEKKGAPITNKSLNKGFLNRYSQGTITEDFAVIATYSFQNPVKMKELCLKYPIINEKVEFLKRFYEEISDGEINQTYWRNLGLE